MKLWIIITAIISGCVGAAAAKLVIPPARAQNGQRWEYFCLDGQVGKEWFVGALNKAGQEGWELASSGASLYGPSKGWCFKRPLP